MRTRLKPVGLLHDRIDEYVINHLTDEMGARPHSFAVNGLEPILLFSREPDVYPLYADLGDERFAITVEISVWRIEKGGPEDDSCTEVEAYPPTEPEVADGYVFDYESEDDSRVR